MAQEKRDWTQEELEKHTVGKMTAVTIPVNISMSGKQAIVGFDELEKILSGARRISQAECECRRRVGGCIDPMDGCLGIDSLADEMIESGDAREITLHEALEAMKRTYDAGFVHMAYTFEGKDSIEYICSCCSCCCHSLGAALRFGYEDHVFSSKYLAVQDADRCEACGVCVDRCQFDARSIVDGELQYEQDMCFGCGLCIKTCPEEAIDFVGRA